MASIGTNTPNLLQQTSYNEVQVLKDMLSLVTLNETWTGLRILRILYFFSTFTVSDLFKSEV